MSVYHSARAVTVAVTTASPAVVGCHRGCACDVTHSITSIIQSFVNKCNNTNSCTMFYLDYKSANSQITSNAIFERKKTLFILHSAYLFCDERWTLLGNQILNR